MFSCFLQINGVRDDMGKPTKNSQTKKHFQADEQGFTPADLLKGSAAM